MADGSTPDIQNLEREISDLKAALTRQREENRLLEAWRNYIFGRQPEDENADVTKALVKSLEYQKEMLKNLTGVAITGSRSENISQGGKTKMIRDAKTGHWRRETVKCEDESKMSLIKRQVIDGSCGINEFQLQFDIEENMNSDADIEGRVHQLTISASENIYTDLGDTIERLANERNAQGFLRLLDFYEMWRTARETTFQHFLAKYPKIAKSPNTKVIEFKHPTKKFTFVIEWNLSVTDVYRIVPDIQLTVQIPKKVRPETDVLNLVPERFQLMLTELGIEKTFNTLVSLLLR